VLSPSKAAAEVCLETTESHGGKGQRVIFTHLTITGYNIATNKIITVFFCVFARKRLNH
jgi:hypothetical protein